MKFKAKSELNIQKPEEALILKGQTEEVWDFSKITIDKLGQDIESSLNSKAPRFLWSKRRLNEKIVLDNDKQVLILNKIQNLRAIGNELTSLKAGDIFNEEYIQLLVADKRMLAQQYFEKTIAEHRLSLTKTKSEIDLVNAKIDHEYMELDRKRAENEKIRAVSERLNAETDSIKTQNELKRIVMSKIDFNNFPPVYTTYLLAVLSGVNAEAFSDLDIKEKLKDVMVNMEESKAKKAEAEVNDFINSAEFRKWQFERDKKSAEKNGKL